MKKLAFKMELKPASREEYKKRHVEIWPELKSLLMNSGIRDDHIFLDADTGVLFAVQKQSGEKSSQDLGSNPIVQRWWKYMPGLMETHPDFSPVSVSPEEVFYMK